MNILLTGDSGFIGKNLGPYLQTLGHTVEGFEWKGPNILPDPEKYDSVIHLGAISSTTETDVEKVLIQNHEFTMNLIQLCDKFGVNMQIASSASVYGQGLDGYKEESKCLPQSPYAWSKYLTDRFLIQAGLYQKEFNMNLQVFRYFNVYGPYEDHKNDQASPIHKFTQQDKNNKVIKVFENSENYKRDFICVSDVCRVHESMLKTDTSGIFNVGTGTTTSFQDVAEIIANKYDAKIETIEMPDKLKSQYQEYTCADLTNLNKHCKINDYMTVKEYIHAY